MIFANVFDAEVINYQKKKDWAPSVAAEYWCEGTLVVVVDHQALF